MLRNLLVALILTALAVAIYALVVIQAAIPSPQRTAALVAWGLSFGMLFLPGNPDLLLWPSERLKHPLTLGAPALILLVPYLVLTLFSGQFTWWGLLGGLLVLALPTAAAVVNGPQAATGLTPLDGAVILFLGAVMTWGWWPGAVYPGWAAVTGQPVVAFVPLVIALTAYLMGVVRRTTDFGYHWRLSREDGEWLATVFVATLALALPLGFASGAMTLGVKKWVNMLPIEQYKPGDVFITNDPWLLAGHLNDVCVMSPMFYKDKVVGFTACVFHHSDIGGRVSSDNHDVFEDGLLIPPVKLYDGVEVCQSVMDFIQWNVRTPEEVIGDIRSQIAANYVCTQKVVELLQDAGLDNFDILGISYYYIWSEVPLANVSNYVSVLKRDYGKEVMVMETAYPWTTANADTYGNIIDTAKLIPEYPPSIEGQYQYLVTLTQEIIDGGGKGIFYWEPGWITSSMVTQWGTGSAWDCNALYDFNGNVIKGMDFMTYPYSF